MSYSTIYPVQKTPKRFMFEFLLSANLFLNLRVRHCADRSRLGIIAEVHSAADTT